MKNKIIKASLLTIFLVLLTIFGIFNLTKNFSNAEEESESITAKPGNLMEGENDPSNYSYNTDFGTWEFEKYECNAVDGLYIPKKDGYQIYCISRDAHIVYAWEITYDELEKAKAEETPRRAEHKHATNFIYQGKTITTHTVNGYGKFHASIHGDEYGYRKNEFRTPIKWVPDGTSSSLTAAMAYIVSDETVGKWTTEKQKAIWNLSGTGLDDNLIESATGESDATSLETAAKNYAKYHSEVEPKQGLEPKDLTNISDITTKVDQSKSKYTVGPYNITYTNGTYGGITFGGISDVKIIGYNSNKEKVKEFDVSEFVIDGEKDPVTPQYFTPSSDLKVDTQEQKYPKSGKSFQIIFDDPNDGLGVKDPNRVEYISLRVEFKYMLAYGKKTKYRGSKQTLSYTEEHPNGTHAHTWHHDYTDEEGETHCTPACWTDPTCPVECEKSYDVVSMEQQPIIAADAIRCLYEQELEVGKDTPVDITMDIEGQVWEDEKSGKETTADGERQNSEKSVPNIPVILYHYVENKKDNENDEKVDTTSTDGEGKYKFENLDAMKKYYVEFQYNGQQYENAKYEDNLDGKHSTATETTTDRAAFNKKFEEIDGDEGYSLKQLTYEDGDRAAYYNAPEIFTISAFTGNDGKNDLVKYPKMDKFVIATSPDGDYEAVYKDDDNENEKNSIKHIDFGITQRIEFDMALKKDLYAATVKINGKTEVYGYDKKLANVEDGQKANSEAGYAQWTISFDGTYERGLDNTDWGFSGQNGNKDGLLEVYATYKIAVRNQSMSMLGHVTKLYDYYDSTYEYQPDLSWQTSTNYKTNKDTLDKLQDSMEKGTTNDFGSLPNAADDKNGTLTIDVNKKQKTGETEYLYLTFKIKNGSDGRVSLGEKTNKAEIGTFKTYYKAGTNLPHYNGTNDYTVPDDNMIAGRVDRDSIPSSMGKDKEPNKKNDLDFEEDDEDKAPGLDVKLTGNNRILNGTVWEDERNINSGNAMIGDGIMGNNETKIAGVKVELVEKTVWDKQNPTGEYVWKTKTTDSNGKYQFDKYIPGDYVVRFTYGEDLSGTSKNKGKSYNGQDYKSTTYQAGITQTATTDLDGKYKGYNDVNNQNETGTYGYNIATKKDNVSDAKDIWSRRNAVNQYSNNYGKGVTNGLAEILASPYQTPNYNGTQYTASEMNALLNELINNTKMTAESGVVVVEVECNKQSEEENGNPSYSIENLNLGLVERPKAQLEIDKSITNIKVTLANSTVLFDVNKAGDNVIWKDHAEYNLASHKKNNKYEEYYGKNGKNRYSYREEVDNIVRNADKGLVQLTMDEELMHGATIEITYQVKVTNVGEVDYEGQKFYYTGDNSGGKVVTTRANTVVDYVANNLQFNSNDSRNKGWSVVTKDALTNQNLVNSKLTDQINKFNTIIETAGLDKELIPGASTTKTLVLSQLITAENKSDDLTYSNMVEIVKTSNTVGRRMAYSVVGNQDPTASKAAEVDASIAEKVIILPPFGEKHIFYILGAVIGIILIGGITFIIRKVLKK